MSQTHTIQFTCPSCNEAYDVTQYSLIDPNNNPEDRTRFLTGELFMTTCPHCQHQQLVAYQSLYLDSEKKFAVHLREQNAPSTVALLPDHILREEYTLHAYIERVRILDAGLNDMAFELFRTVLLNQLRRQYPDKQITMLRFQTIENDNLYLQIQGDEQIRVPYESYKTVEDKVKASGFDMETAGYVHIDGQWVNQSGIIQALQNKK